MAAFCYCEINPDENAHTGRNDGWVRVLGTRRGFRKLGLGRAMMLHAMRRAKAAGAIHATVVCKGAPGHPRARGLYYGVGFRELSRDVPLIKPASARTWSAISAGGSGRA